MITFTPSHFNQALAGFQAAIEFLKGPIFLRPSIRSTAPSPRLASLFQLQPGEAQMQSGPYIVAGFDWPSFNSQPGQREDEGNASNDLYPA